MSHSCAFIFCVRDNTFVQKEGSLESDKSQMRDMFQLGKKDYKNLNAQYAKLNGEIMWK